MTLRMLERMQPRRRGRTRMLHPEYPIEQAVHSKDALVQAELMGEIWRGLGLAEDGAMLIADPEHLRVLARTEDGLHTPVTTLRARYGEALVVEAPAVRYAHGAPVLEPYMRVLLCGPARYLPIVQHNLVRRRGYARRLDDDGVRFVLEGEAPLAGLLGYRDWLLQRIGGEAQVRMRLSRYVPIDGDDGPRAA